MAGSRIPDYDPAAGDFRSNPFPYFHQLRSYDPIHWSEARHHWVLTRYEDIKLVLGDPRFGIAIEMLEESPAIRSGMMQTFNRVIRPQILTADPPAHTRIRALMAKGFTASRLDALRPLIQRCTDECIDRALETGKVELISGFAYRMPFLVICEMMGVPDEEREPLETWTHDLMRSTDPTPITHEELYRCNRAAMGFRDYFLSLVARRAKAPGETILDEMYAACVEEKISWDEMIANFILLFCAGHDTVVNLFGNGLLALHRHPDQLALLRQDPSLIRNAVEELLRFDTSVTIARRTALEDVQIRDRTLGRGHYVVCCLNAGNRDPEVFPDPDTLDVRRKNVRPLSFGGGIHYCLGAQLARIEGEIGFSTLLRRVPELELETLEPRWRQNTTVRGLESMPARCRKENAGVDMQKPYVQSAAGAAPVAVTPASVKAATDWLKYDARTQFFTYALQYINWERVEGDILEFGVSVGKSFALLAQLFQENLNLWHYLETECTGRRFGGFDSFTGLPPNQHPHPRWQAGSFGKNYLRGHPTLAFDETITAGSIFRLFQACGLPRPELEVGLFEDTIPQVIPSKYQKAALVHIDSDLYPSAKCVLEGVAPILADGALVLFDDWFMYKGDPNEGEARALREFLEEHPEWMAIPYQTYSVFCNSFILRRR